MTRQEAEEKAYTLVTRGVAQRVKILLVADALMAAYVAAYECGRAAEAGAWHRDGKRGKPLIQYRGKPLNQSLEQADQD